MPWFQRRISLGPFQRGFQLVTRQIVDALPELATYRIGQLQVFIQHTSASLTINENADAEVRTDLEAVWSRAKAPLPVKDVVQWALQVCNSAPALLRPMKALPIRHSKKLSSVVMPVMLLRLYKWTRAFQ